MFVDLSASDGRETAMMGGSIRAGRLALRVQAAGASGATCVWIKRGIALATDDVAEASTTLTRTVDAKPGDWFSVLVIQEGRTLLTSNAVFVTP